MSDTPPYDLPADAPNRIPLDTTVIARKHITAWLCSGPGNAWDDFLRGAAMGQFQQSSLWAQTKEMDGWKNILVVIEQDERIFGGFQILWKDSRLGRVGYISKGPVLTSEEDSDVVSFVLDLLQEVVRSHRLLAIIVQPPDEAKILPRALRARGFLPNHLINVVSATCMVDLTGPAGEWEKNAGRSRRNEIRQALRGPLSVREGGADDVPKFFELMAATCVRQHTQPNPSSVEALRRLVLSFQSSGELRLTFADYEGEAIACAMALKFGDRVTIWKKGWSGAHARLHANALLYYESLVWAQRAGLKRLDFAGMGRVRAEKMLAQRELTEEEMKDRDVFHLSFGAQPRLLPESLIYWNRAALRFLYSLAFEGALGKIVGRLRAKGDADHA